MATKPKKKPNMDEIATVEKDITQYFLGKVLINPDKVLSSEAKGEGLQLYRDLERDARVYSDFLKRRLAVTGKEWDVEPASDDAADVEIADFVKKNFEGIGFDRACGELLKGILLGFKPLEIMWDYSEGDIWIKEFKGRNPKRFTFDKQNRLRLLTWANMIEGEELPDRKFQILQYDLEDDNPFGIGLGQKLYWPVWFKKNGVKFWAVFAEKFGMPTAVGKYPSGTIKEKQDELLNALKAIQSDIAIKIPDTMAVEFLEATRTGSIATYKEFCDFWNQEITLAILGQEASTVGTPGKLGEETTREQVRQDIIKADADLLCEYLNQQSVRWVVDYNFPGVTEYPKLWKRTEPEQDLKPLAERDRIIVREIGLPTAKKYFYDSYGIPEPQPDEEVVVPPAAGPAPLGFADPVEYRTGLHRASRKFAEPDWVAEYMTRLQPSLKNVKADALKQIEEWLRSQSSPPSEEIFLSKIQTILGSAYQGIDKAAVIDAVSNIFSTFKGVFGGADVRAINFLGNLDHFYLSKFIDNPDAQAVLQDFLKKQYLERGAGLFGRGDPALIKEMQNLLSQNLTDLEGYQINRIVDTGVVRIRNWAHISQLNDAAIAEIEIVEPTMECPFCAQMNGQVIQVDVAYKNMMDQAGMTPDEYQQFLQDNPPSLDGIENYMDQGMLPPYHPHCRGRIIKRVTG